MKEIFEAIRSSSQPVILVANSMEKSVIFKKSYSKALEILPSDIIDFYPEEGIEVLRSKIANLQIMPHSSKFRLFTIFSAEALSIEQANTLLKILEEPPSYVRIIIFSSSLAKIIPTIKSRSQKYVLPRGETETVFDLLPFFKRGEFNEFIRAIKDIESKDIPAILEKMMKEIREKNLGEKYIQLYKRVGDAVIRVTSTNANGKLELEKIFIWWKSVNKT